MFFFKKKQVFIFLFFLLYTCQNTVGANAIIKKKNYNNINIEKVLINLKNRYNMPFLEVDFYQISKSKKDSILDLSYGKFFILNRNKAEWKYIQPFCQKLKIDNISIWVLNEKKNDYFLMNKDSSNKGGIDVSLFFDSLKLKQNFFIFFKKKNENFNFYEFKILPKNIFLEILEVYIKISVLNFDVICVKSIGLCGNEIIIKFRALNLEANTVF